MRVINLHLQLISPPKVDVDVYDSILGQLDNAADVSVTQMQHYLHEYRAFNKSFRCPLVLVPADGVKITPKSVGYLRVPAPTPPGFYDILSYYYPEIKSTLLSYNSFLTCNGKNNTTLVRRHTRTKTKRHLRLLHTIGGERVRM
jgi:hypothetical protein